MHFLERKEEEKRGQCNRYLAVHALSQKNKGAAMGREKERGIEHVYGKEHQKGKGKSRVSDIRRSDHKHKGIYIQIFKHS